MRRRLLYRRLELGEAGCWLLSYCAEGKNERFGVIEFAVGADVTPEFKRSVAEVKKDEWHSLEREGGHRPGPPS